MKPLEWSKLIRDFDERRCVLMIGPRINSIKKEDHWEPFVEELAVHLSKILTENEVGFEADANRSLPYISQQLLNIPGARRVDLEDFSKDFYQLHENVIPDIYLQLADLPVEIIVNTAPDDYIVKALEAKGKQCFSYHYNFHREQELNIDPDQFSAQRPLVYNLFGAFENPESLVLTDNDQLEFVRNIVRDDPKIPDEILGLFDQRKTYLFFGFNLENWQFRLLLDGLQLKPQNTTISPNMSEYPVSNLTKSFYKNRFNFMFTEDEVDTFLGTVTTKIASRKKAPVEVIAKDVFIIYNENETDKKYLEELMNSLQPMIGNKHIRVWHRGMLELGTIAEEAVNQKMEVSTVFLLLLSTNLLADEAVMERDYKIAVGKQKAGTAKLIPIPTRACDWQAIPDLKNLIPLPTNGHPINSVHWNSRDDAYQQIVQELKKRLS